MVGDGKEEWDGVAQEGGRGAGLVKENNKEGWKMADQRQGMKGMGHEG